MAKLWQKNTTLDALIEGYTVGRDDQLDQQLLPADALASMAAASASPVLTAIGPLCATLAGVSFLSK